MENLTTVKKEGMTEMQKRSVTAVVYVIVWIALTAFKWLVPTWGALGFDAAFWAISVLGGMEYLRAVGNEEHGFCNISAPQKTFTVAFCAVIVPLYVLVEMTMAQGMLAVACAFCVYVIFLAGASVFDHAKSTVKGTIICVFGMLYCGVLSTILAGVNHLPQNSMIAILALFMCTVFTDTGAFLIGSALKKVFPAKLAPQLSPNKTIVGAVGGILGGILGGIVAYFTMYIFGGVNGVSTILGEGYGVYLTFTSPTFHPIVALVLVGLVTSVMAQIGDLFESAVKRECHIKDMGKVLPGHGGVLDRFDSMLYCSVIILLAFGTLIV